MNAQDTLIEQYRHQIAALQAELAKAYQLLEKAALHIPVVYDKNFDLPLSNLNKNYA